MIYFFKLNRTKINNGIYNNILDCLKGTPKHRKPVQIERAFLAIKEIVIISN